MNDCTGLLHVKYPTARYAPLVGCPYCNGTGERPFTDVRPSWQDVRPCLCLFVSHVSVLRVAEMRKQAVEGEIA